MCVCSVKRPVKACAKGGYSKKPPPSNPPEPAFHPSICVWGLVGFVFSTYLSNTSHSQSWNVPKDGSLMLLSSNNMVSYGYKYSHLGTSNCSHSLFVFLMRNVSGETGDGLLKCIYAMRHDYLSRWYSPLWVFLHGQGFNWAKFDRLKVHAIWNKNTTIVLHVRKPWRKKKSFSFWRTT